MFKQLIQLLYYACTYIYTIQNKNGTIAEYYSYNFAKSAEMVNNARYIQMVIINEIYARYARIIKF